ncbi:hypothetical protein FKW77_007724 [Venturia effusa]|uniref:Uncharacterized protein n=1 Tax=Venturia effusa TaxID=50376 RepID=A0A517L9M1_9PEZI|nr:hypothetical protein FKW77_007724 [Venturia effusa]
MKSMTPSLLLAYATLASARFHHQPPNPSSPHADSAASSNITVSRIPCTTSIPSIPVITTTIPIKETTTLTSTTTLEHGYGHGLPAGPPSSAQNSPIVPPKSSTTPWSSPAPPLIHPPSSPSTSSSPIGTPINYGFPPINVTVPVAPVKPVATSASSSPAAHGHGYDMPAPHSNSSIVAPVKPVTAPSNIMVTGLGHAAPTGHPTTVSVVVSSRVSGTPIVPTKSVSPAPFVSGTASLVVSRRSAVVMVMGVIVAFISLF